MIEEGHHTASMKELSAERKKKEGNSTSQGLPEAACGRKHDEEEGEKKGRTS